MVYMRLLIVALCALVGCKNADSVPASRPPAISAEPSASSVSSAPSSPSAAPPKADVVLRVTRAGKGYDIEAIQTSGEAFDLVDLVQAERHDDDKWIPAGYALRMTEQCGPSVSNACLQIAKGASLKLPTWVGMTCDPRCSCKANAELKPGEYRFVAFRCGTTTGGAVATGKMIVSEPVKWPP